MGTARKRPAVTQASLARQLGVNVSTVSRALSPNPVGVGDEMVSRIRELAGHTGYRNNGAARALRTGQTKMIGVMVPRLTDVVQATIYDGADRAAVERGYNTVVVNTLDQPDLQRLRLDLLLSRQVDGVILSDSRDDANIIPEIKRTGLPFLLMTRRLRGQISITTDDITGGRLAAEHLLALGHRHVAVVAGDVHASTGRERTSGFVQAFAAAGHPIRDDWIVPSGGFDVVSGRRAAEEIFASGTSSPSAVFAVNDFAAVGVMAAARDAGLTPGHDLAVVGYNDLELASQLPVALTSVHSPLFEMGSRAMQTLLDMLAGKKVRSKRLTPTLVERASTLDVVVRKRTARKGVAS